MGVRPNLGSATDEFYGRSLVGAIIGIVHFLKWMSNMTYGCYIYTIITTNKGTLSISMVLLKYYR